MGNKKASLIKEASVILGAEGGNRTHNPFREREFESRASASSATSAMLRKYNEFLSQGQVM